MGHGVLRDEAHPTLHLGQSGRKGSKVWVVGQSGSAAELHEHAPVEPLRHATKTRGLHQAQLLLHSSKKWVAPGRDHLLRQGHRCVRSWGHQEVPPDLLEGAQRHGQVLRVLPRQAFALAPRSQCPGRTRRGTGKGFTRLVARASIITPIFSVLPVLLVIIVIVIIILIVAAIVMTHLARQPAPRVAPRAPARRVELCSR
mmetsp:Transcript_26985/g.78554  ORF Transcript_26985/g.78554 Transcript_26985/m.78554 type:complete len:200 (+) Transcript_26985:787-1386(+)